MKTPNTRNTVRILAVSIAALLAAHSAQAAAITWSSSCQFMNQNGVATDSYAQLVPGLAVNAFTITNPGSVTDSVHGRTLNFIRSGSGIANSGGGGFGGPTPAPTTGDDISPAI